MRRTRPIEPSVQTFSPRNQGNKIHHCEFCLAEFEEGDVGVLVPKSYYQATKAYDTSTTVCLRCVASIREAVVKEPDTYCLLVRAAWSEVLSAIACDIPNSVKTTRLYEAINDMAGAAEGVDCRAAESEPSK